jgi:hypothetical protein
VRVAVSTITGIEDIKLGPASVRIANPCGESIHWVIVRVPDGQHPVRVRVAVSAITGIIGFADTEAGIQTTFSFDDLIGGTTSGAGNLIRI